MLNEACVELAVRAALALNCKIERVSFFDRKHYKYQDLPAGYQITQNFNPFAVGGSVTIADANGSKAVRIRQVHIEQDSAKTLLDENGNVVLIDLNRCGVGLVEIVTEPEVDSGSEAVALAKRIREILVDARVCEGVMAHGHLRFDANVSVFCPTTPNTKYPLGVPVELKNINSFASLRSAIDYETRRQTDVLEAGGEVRRETRGFDERGGWTMPLRDKNESSDYRFVRENDLPPLVITEEQVERVRQSMPESKARLYERMLQLYGLRGDQVEVLAQHSGLLDLFEFCAERCPDHSLVLNFLTNEYLGLLSRRKVALDQSPVRRESLQSLLVSMHSGATDNYTGKQTVVHWLSGGEQLSPPQTIERPSGSGLAAPEGYLPEEYSAVLRELAQKNPKKVPRGAADRTILEVAQVKGGEERAVDFFVGPLMKINSNRIQPKDLRPMVARYVVDCL